LIDGKLPTSSYSHFRIIFQWGRGWSMTNLVCYTIRFSWIRMISQSPEFSYFWFSGRTRIATKILVSPYPSFCFWISIKVNYNFFELSIVLK
jgi:hypothetical protein